MWNFFDQFNTEILKTNNDMEVWENILKNTPVTSRFSFKSLIYKFKDEQEVARQNKIRNDGGEILRRKRPYL